MRRKWAAAAAVMAATAVVAGMAAVTAVATSGPGRGPLVVAPPGGSPTALGSPAAPGSPAAAASSAAPGLPVSAVPAGRSSPGPRSSPTTRAETSPGACPSGGLDWTDRVFAAVPVDSSDGYWLVQEHGKVRNSSPAAIILGDGVARVGRSGPAGADAPVMDLPLTPLGSLTLMPGQREQFSAAIMVKSASRPTDLGLGLSNATWKSPALLSGCPPPAGSAAGPDALVAIRVD